ncbi:DMT family transporter [Bradyrhizobium prioriisuperbiae]|uniref:DMT family transporter n=1 Tax=Bradyrhizobium prioriisuperbiae TaxID=2854389 RepID=UPI0028EEE18D|nr:DMT family transporter [Bradyrhizobium prioritasuperba]
MATIPDAPSGAQAQSAVLAGIGLMLMAVFTFSFGDALGKYIVATYSVGQLLWLRACAAFLIIAPMMWRQRTVFTALERPALQIARIVFSTAEVGMFFLAAVYLPLADIITCYLAAPIFVTAASAIFLGEHVGWRRWSAVAVGFCGVLIALQPSSQSIGWPSLIALTGSLSFSVLMVITRMLRKTPDVVLAASQFAGTFTVGAVLAPFGWVTPSLPDLGLFVVAGLISVSALFCLNRSLKLAPASIVVPYQYTMIIWAVIFGYVVFNDVPSMPTLIGAAIIIGAGLYIFLREQALGRGAEVVDAPPG